VNGPETSQANGYQSDAEILSPCDKEPHSQLVSVVIPDTIEWMIPFLVFRSMERRREIATCACIQKAVLARLDEKLHGGRVSLS
jgi:hypothetical protein